MSLKDEDTCLSDDRAENSADPARGSRITYARDFLLLLSELDVCKNLPDGFDRSLLSEFEDASQDRHRASGSFASHGFRRTEYGSSPPTRGDQGNYSRGNRGRWDSRSSGRSDKDSDSQPDLESETGRRYGTHSRRPWQAPEHDGLLGSGSFPRPSGYATGSSLPKSRPNERYHLNKSSEPYHPPRPYKAGPQPRRETRDSYNDETFGSLEFTSEDRAEEERKRRASFELMRKNQVKAIHANQKLNPDKRKGDFDITTLMEGSSDEKKVIDESSNSDKAVKEPAVSGISENSLLSKGPTCRPLVPPGFKNSAPEKNIGTKSLGQHDAAEVRNLHPEDNHLADATHNNLLNGIKHDEESKRTGEKLVFGDQQENSSNCVSTKNDSTGTVKVIETTEMKELGGQNRIGNPTSIIENLFSGALIDDNSSADEHLGSNADEIWTSRTLHSSKFAQWFLEEDQKTVEGLSSGQKNDLFSLIGGGERNESKAIDSKATEHFSKNAFQYPEQPDRNMTSTLTTSITGNSEQLYREGQQKSVNAFLTCEDLEQKMLLEARGSGPNSLPQLQGWSTPENDKLSKAAVDDQASHHLLSLLQKGTGQKDMTQTFNPDVGSLGNVQRTKGEVNMSANNLRNEDTEINPKLGDAMTLETLFGNAFMKELQSARAPVSVQRGLSGPVGGDVSKPAEFSCSIKGNGIASPVQATSASPENNVAVPNLIENINPGGTGQQYIGFRNSGMIADPLHLQINSGSIPGGSGKYAEAPVPESGNLFAVGDPLNLLSLKSTNTSVDIAEKFASLNSVVRDERSYLGARDGVPLFHGPHGSRVSDLPYNLQVHQSQQLHTPELNHGGQMFHPLSSHSANIAPQMNFIPPDVIRHNSPPNQYNVDVFRAPFHPAPSGVAAFDQPSHHHMLQQMQVQGGFPPMHLHRGIPPGVHLQPHPSNQAVGFMPELGPVQGLPPSHPRPNFDSPSVPMLAPQLGGSSNHPEALQRLIEMELRSKQKQIHPFASAGHSHLDMGFGYR